MTNSTSESSSTPADPYGDLIRRARELIEALNVWPLTLKRLTYTNWQIKDKDNNFFCNINAVDATTKKMELAREFAQNELELLNSVPDLANALEAARAENAQLKAWLATIARVFNPKPPEEREEEE